MERILVTGGCGFIGSEFVRQQLRANPEQEVMNLDRLTYAGNPENLAECENHPRYRFIHGDIADRSLVAELLADGVDAVVNFAAESHVDRSILDTGPFLKANVLGTQVLMDACREAGTKRFVQISTDEVYGSLGEGDGLFTEETPLAPNSPYAASKAAADLLVRSYVHTFGFPGLITRCSNNYGPYQFPEKLIPLFVTNAIDNKPLPVYGTGRNVRDWIHVSDHCRAIDAVLRQGRIGESYNIGGRCEKTNLEITHLLLKLLEKPESLIQYVTDRPGHDLRYAIDSSKIENELGWKPEVAFEEGLRETIAWYQEHGDWVSRIKSGAYRQYYEAQYGARLSE